MLIKLGIVPFTLVEQKCSALVFQKTGDAAVVDLVGDIDKILEAVQKMGYNVKGFVNPWPS
jgi:hypothetical protein